MRATRRVLVAVVMAAGLLLLARTDVSAAVLVVDDTSEGCNVPPPTFRTIQAAVNASGPGDTILVCPGTYTEEVAIRARRNLTVRSVTPYAAVIRPPSKMTQHGLVAVTATLSATIEGFTIAGPFPDGVTPTAVRASDSCVTVRNNVIQDIVSLRGPTNDGSAIDVYNGECGTDGDAVVIAQNVVRRYNFIGIFTDNYPSSRRVVITNNLVSGSGEKPPRTTGIYTVGAYMIVSSNVITDNGLGVFMIAGEPGSTIGSNIIRSNKIGMFISGGRNSLITSNQVSDGERGIITSDSIGHFFSLNSALGNGTDCEDGTKGSGTAGTANVWTLNTGTTSQPLGLCNIPPRP